MLLTITSILFPQSFKKIFKKNSPACVRIDTEIPDDMYGDVGGCGSGFIIDESGIIITNHHVIDGAKKIYVTLENGIVYEAQGFYIVDERLDFAILQIPGFDLPTLRLGDSKNIDVDLSFLGYESLIPRARNTFVARFLADSKNTVFDFFKAVELLSIT